MMTLIQRIAQNLPHLAITLALLLGCFVLAGGIQPAHAASAEKIDRQVNDTLEDFTKEIKGAQQILSKAKGVLVLPKVYKAGIGIGGEYGEGSLRVGGHTADYYNMLAGSWGFQLGAQKKSVILAFMTDEALRKFRDSEGWKVGVDASVALVKLGAEGNIDTTVTNKPVIGFVFGQRGLMYDLSLEGAKFSKLNK